MKNWTLTWKCGGEQMLTSDMGNCMCPVGFLYDKNYYIVLMRGSMFL